MTCLDVIFPINLGPLTYRCPGHLRALAQPGMKVSAPLKRSIAKGIISRVHDSPPEGPLKEIAGIEGPAPAFSPAALKLIRWLSEYHGAPEGLILKQSVPKELFTSTKRRGSEDQVYSAPLLPALPEADLASLRAAASPEEYRTTLLHAPSAMEEYAAAAALLAPGRRSILLFPEIAQAELFYGAVRESLGDRVCLLHSDMSAGRRSELIEAVMAGSHEVIVGTRIALFAPLRDLSLILLLHEHSPSYKLEEGIRINIRDTAVMRGYLEKIPVILTSSAPSLDSWFNAKSGKYDLLTVRSESRRPAVRTVDVRFRKKQASPLAPAVTDSAKRALKGTGSILFIINRRGHATFLLCADCGSTASCPDCQVPLVLHKDRNILACHYCAKTLPVPDDCSKCGSSRIEQLGAGTQRIEEELKKLFGLEPLRVDSDSAGKKRVMEEQLRSIAAHEARLIVGTKLLTKRLPPTGSFSLAAHLNIDVSLNIPDFRARERAYQELAALRDLVAPKGEVLIQTRFADDSLFKHLREGTYEAFAAEELAVRQDLSLPPYSRLLRLLAYGSSDLQGKILKILHDSAPEAEVLGPTETKSKKGLEYAFLLKHGERKVLHAAAQNVLQRFRNRKDVEIRIDADPY